MDYLEKGFVGSLNTWWSVAKQKNLLHCLLVLIFQHHTALYECHLAANSQILDISASHWHPEDLIHNI